MIQTTNQWFLLGSVCLGLRKRGGDHDIGDLETYVVRCRDCLRPCGRGESCALGFVGFVVWIFSGFWPTRMGFFMGFPVELSLGRKNTANKGISRDKKWCFNHEIRREFTTFHQSNGHIFWIRSWFQLCKRAVPSGHQRWQGNKNPASVV